MRKIRKYKYSTLLLGIFSACLGLGNIIVGTHKGQQYEGVYNEIAALAPNSPEFLANNSPLTKLKYSHQHLDRIKEKQKKAMKRRDLYRTVTFGGKTLLSIGLILIVWQSAYLLYRAKKTRLLRKR